MPPRIKLPLVFGIDLIRVCFEQFLQSLVVKTVPRKYIDLISKYQNHFNSPFQNFTQSSFRTDSIVRSDSAVLSMFTALSMVQRNV